MCTGVNSSLIAVIKNAVKSEFSFIVRCFEAYDLVRQARVLINVTIMELNGCPIIPVNKLLPFSGEKRIP